jgi:electron transfer flavoprotein beta subunit
MLAQICTFAIRKIKIINTNMKILVCITKAPDTTTKITFTDNDTKFNEQGVTWIINPYDEWYSLVRALELKEAGLATEIHLVTVGLIDTEAVIRKALALGGDEAIRIDTESTDTFQVASEIANIAREGNYGLVLCGKESIDYNNGSFGASLAELLQLPFVANVTKLDITENTVTLNREIEGGEETCTCVMPMVISCQKGLAEARIPNMRGIMAARTKPLKIVPAINTTALTTIVSYELPPAKSGVKMIAEDNLDELVRLLHEEAKVI